MNSEIPGLVVAEKNRFRKHMHIDSTGRGLYPQGEIIDERGSRQFPGASLLT